MVPLVTPGSNAGPWQYSPVTATIAVPWHADEGHVSVAAGPPAVPSGMIKLTVPPAPPPT